MRRTSVVAIRVRRFSLAQLKRGDGPEFGTGGDLLFYLSNNSIHLVTVL